jgi:hypothetical protein
MGSTSSKQTRRRLPLRLNSIKIRAFLAQNEWKWRAAPLSGFGVRSLARLRQHPEDLNTVIISGEIVQGLADRPVNSAILKLLTASGKFGNIV